VSRISGLAFAALSMWALGASAVRSQDYPSKPVRIITSGAGGGSDLVSRLVAQGISGSLGQPVIVENRGSGIVASSVAQAPPDGYTLLGSPGSLWLAPFLGKVTYDPLRDFAPISLTNRAPTILAVHPALPVKSVKELIALAKARPGALNYSSGGNGTTSHLAGELLKSMAGIDIVRIVYKTQVSADLLSGEVQLVFGSAGAVMPHVKSGRLRALAVTSAQPSVLVPGLPTVASAGLPGFEIGTIFGFFAPGKTPESIVKRLNQEIVRFIRSPEAKERLISAGVEPVGSTPEELTATMKSEMARLGKVIKSAGITAD
jgi:tripartite-type tricarboxylate transporter receptor subunit TctC